MSILKIAIDMLFYKLGHLKLTFFFEDEVEKTSIAKKDLDLILKQLHLPKERAENAWTNVLSTKA